MQTNKVALVTGASRGIGAATALLLAKRGYAVAVNYATSKAKADEVVRTIVDAGGSAIALYADMGDEAQIAAMFARVAKELGPVSALVNNAGVTHGGAVEALDAAEMQHVFAVNTFGVFLACREAIAHMKQAGGGAIVNVTSQAAIFGGNKMAVYAASKAAVNTLTIGLAREVAPLGIRVNAVSPAVIDTDMQAGISQERRQHLESTMPLGRMGTAEETAEAIAWLLSDAASYVSGAILPVSGAR